MLVCVFCNHGKVGAGLDWSANIELGRFDISLRIIQSTSLRVCELANHRVTVKWK